MTCLNVRILSALGGLLLGWSLFAAEADLTDYRTVATAVVSKIRVPPPDQTGRTGFLGAVVERNAQGVLVVAEVQSGSPAEKAGLQKGDLVTHIADQAVRTPEGFREWLQARAPGEEVLLKVSRAEKPVTVRPILSATSRPKKAIAERVFLGVQLVEEESGNGVRVEQVVDGSPAASAGLKAGDRVTKVEGTPLKQPSRLTEVLSTKRPGESITFVVQREGKDVSIPVRLSGEPTGGGGGRGGRGGPGGGFGGRGGGDGPPPTTLWRKDRFRLAVVTLEYPDIKHNDKITNKEWTETFFARGTAKTDADASSLNDYCHEQSGGAFRVEGKVFEWVTLAKKRSEYVQGSGTSGKSVPLVEALGKVTSRDGQEAFKEFDGFLFLYAGERVGSNRGSLYSPHAGTVSYQGKRWPYFLGPEGGSRKTPLGGFVKQFAQVLGLPDLAARPENVGSEGLGVWCALSNPLTTGRPQHFNPWAKERLGWITPTVLDPSVKQKLLLSPIELSTKECFKILVRPDGSEYFLLENRRKAGFDANLPGEGLLIWRVVGDRPLLEESHGIEGPAGPTAHAEQVPYPSTANRAFTPDTIPSSRSPQGGGMPVHINAIQQLPDGRVAFQLGYEYR